MRPLPEKRLRRQNDSPAQIHSNGIKRLTNGFNGFNNHHITTRSQTKVVQKKKLRSPRINNNNNIFNNNNNNIPKKVTNGIKIEKTEKTLKSKVEINNNNNKNETDKEKVRKNRINAAQQRAERAIKRRKSSRWVLNGESDSFIFEDETEKEILDSPLSPASPSISPSKKRRKMRNSEGSPLPNGTSNNVEHPITIGFRERIGSPVPNFIASFTNPQSPLRINIDENLLSPTLTPLNNLVLPENSPQSVRIQNILSNMDYRFSFEDIPNQEAWFQTFSRQHCPRLCIPHSKTKVILPYETKGNRRPRNNLSKLPRKSPRCHASTLAILSSLKPNRKNSTSAPTSPSPISPPIQIQPPPPPPPKKYPAVSPSLSPTQSLFNRNNEMSANQYLWDSIQFLSDPYVIKTLAAEKKLTKCRSLRHFYQQHSNSLLITTKPPGLSPSSTTSCSFLRPGASSPSSSSSTIFSPESSPTSEIKMQGSSNKLDKSSFSSSSSTNSSTNSSPHSSTKSNSNNRSPISTRNSPKNAIVLVSDIFKKKRVNDHHHDHLHQRFLVGGSDCMFSDYFAVR